MGQGLQWELRGKPPAITWRQEQIAVLDLIFAAVTVAFFLAALAYVRFCDRVK